MLRIMPFVFTEKAQKVMATRVLIVDDHPIVRQGISHLVEREPDLQVCGEAEDVHEALGKIEEEKPDVVLVDLSLKESDGMDLVQDIKLRYPEIRVLVLSMHDEKYYADRALRVGARGYLMKDEAPKKVVKAIRRIVSGEIFSVDSKPQLQEWIEPLLTMLA